MNTDSNRKGGGEIISKEAKQVTHDIRNMRVLTENTIQRIDLMTHAEKLEIIKTYNIMMEYTINTLN